MFITFSESASIRTPQGFSCTRLSVHYVLTRPLVKRPVDRVSRFRGRARPRTHTESGAAPSLLVLAVGGWVGIVTVGILVADPPVTIMDDHLAPDPLRGLCGRLDGVGLRVVVRAVPLGTFPTHCPAVIAPDHVGVSQFTQDTPPASPVKLAGRNGSPDYDRVVTDE